MAFTTNEESGDDLKDFVGKCREAAEYMRLVQHSKNCNGTCDNSNKCNSIKELLIHVELCSSDYCDKKGCLQTKKILQHYKKCKENRQHSFTIGSPFKFCLVCSLAVRDEGLSKTPNSINYDCGEMMVKRKFADSDFAVPSLPKRFRDLNTATANSSSSSSKNGIAVDAAGSRDAPSSPSDIATRLSNHINSSNSPVHDKQGNGIAAAPASPVRFNSSSSGDAHVAYTNAVSPEMNGGMLSNELFAAANQNANSVPINGSPRGRWLSM